MKISILLSIVILSFYSCDTSILDQTNPNTYVHFNYIKDANGLTQATNAVYAQFLGSDLWGRNMQYISDCRADEHTIGACIEIANAELILGIYDNSNKTILSLWRGMYRLIFRSNAVIHYGSQLEDIDKNLQNQRIAEAKFLRAYAYYYLNVNFGTIPVYTEIIESPDAAKAPLEEPKLYAFLETELLGIQNHVDWLYTGDNAGRVNRGAVKLMLARVYMHQGKYSEAHEVLLDIYNNGPYKLVDNYYDNFMEETEYNEESIFEIGFAGGWFSWDEDGNSVDQRSTLMFQEYSAVAWRNLIPTDKLLANFESIYNGDAKEDPRLHESVYFIGDTYGDPNNPDTLKNSYTSGNSSHFEDSVIKCSWKKYSPMYKLNPGGYYPSNINYRNMRFAEVLVKLAECENELENSDAARSRSMAYLNEIRQRPSVSLPNYSTANYPCNSYDEMMRAIMHESLVEFSNEKLRVLELARWRKNDKFTALNPDPIAYIAADPSKALLPYPSLEVISNPYINE